MIRLPRWFISLVAILFVISPLATGIIGSIRRGFQTPTLVALALYLIVGIASVLYYRHLRMPTTLALISLIISIVAAQLVHLELDSSSFGTPSTWYVSGVSTLMAICAIRQQKTIAWIGTAALTLEVVAWGGSAAIFNSGLGGAIALVATAHAISIGLGNSAKQTSSYLETAKFTESSTAAESVIRQERSERITKTLSGALPMLKKIAEEDLSDADRREAKILEAELRDEIRGRELINPKFKSAVRAARARGVEVVVLDEGGLDSIPEPERESLRNRLADELDLIQSGRVTIRSPKLEKSRATFVASRKGTPKPDVFLKL